jgi:hypothetical protein
LRQQFLNDGIEHFAFIRRMLWSVVNYLNLYLVASMFHSKHRNFLLKRANVYVVNWYYHPLTTP